MIFPIIFFLVAVLAIDIIAYQGLRSLLKTPAFVRYRKKVLKAYWIADLIFVAFSIVWVIIIRNSSWPDHVQYRNYFFISGTFFLIFFPKATFFIFVLLDQIKNAGIWLLQKSISSGKSPGMRLKGRQSLFLPATGAVAAIMMLVMVAYSIIYGRFNFQVEEVEVYFKDLPQSFDGYRIAHFSDTHLGSFGRTQPVIRGLGKISNLNADIVIFSGDLVNNEAAEVLPYIDHFNAIRAQYGKFTVLGNHDMGDYRRWYTIEEKEVNLQQLEDMQEDMGFTLLRNHNYFIRNGLDSIMIIGIDNWGLPPFSQYGDLEQAMGDHQDFPFQILISHDPSHWRAEVIPHTNIDLMLAGHTHGMQMGIRTKWFSWSPSAYKYPEWNGLYRSGEQAIYVNRGFGFLGFPGRIGMPPEITLITLKKL